MFKKRVFWLFLASLAGGVLGFIFLNNYFFGVCPSDLQANTFDPSCHSFFLRFGDGLSYGMGALAVVFFALLFAPKAVSGWWKFAIWYVPIATYMIAVAGPVPGQMIDFSLSVQETTLWLSGVYILVSLVLIGFSLRKKN